MSAAPPKPPKDTNPAALGTDPVLEQAAQDKLPNSEANPTGTINYLGSSYTGADIKVVVHLYTDVDKGIQEQRLEEELRIAKQVSGGAESLLAGGIDRLISGSRNIFEKFADQEENLSTAAFIAKLTGLDISNAQDRVAASILANAIASINTSLSPQTQVSLANQILQNISQTYSATATQIEEKFRNIAAIRDASANTVTLGNLQTLSVQSFREKNPVRSLGSSYVKGYTRGPRTIAGSMIFTVFNENSLAQLMRSMAHGGRYGEGSDTEFTSLMTDQLPPVDITIVFANEYGSLSSMSLYGVEFVTNGMTLSVEDLLTEEVVQFVARDIDPMVSRGKIGIDRLNRGQHFQSNGAKDTSGTSLLIGNKDEYAKYLEKLKVRMGLLGR